MRNWCFLTSFQIYRVFSPTVLVVFKLSHRVFQKASIPESIHQDLRKGTWICTCCVTCSPYFSTHQMQSLENHVVFNFSNIIFSIIWPHDRYWVLSLSYKSSPEHPWCSQQQIVWLSLKRGVFLARCLERTRIFTTKGNIWGYIARFCEFEL